jgi:hypothetical protein
MIAFPCPKCQTKLKAPEAKAGARTKCPKCDGPVQVPGPPVLTAAKIPAPALPPPLPVPGHPVSNPDVFPEVLPVAERVEAPTRSRCPVKRHKRFPLWVLVAIPAGVLLLCGVVAIALIANNDSGQSAGRAPEGIPKTGGDLSKAISDYDELDKWCERSASDVKTTTAANPIRGKELADVRLKELRDRFLGKEVHWRFPVRAINDRGAAISCCRSHLVDGDEYVDRFGIRRKFDPFEATALYVDFNKPYGGGPGIGVNCQFFDNVPPWQLRVLSVGWMATVTGRVTDVTFLDGRLPPFGIKLADAKIE